MPKTYIQKSRKIFSGKKGQANPNPGSFTTLALKDSLKSLFTGNGNEDHATQGLWILILPILLWIVDFNIGVNGIEWNTLFDTFKLQGVDFFLNLIWRSAFPAIVVLYFIFSRPKNSQEVTYSLILIFLFFTIWTIGKANIWITYHLFFAAIVYIFFLKGLTNGVTQAHKGFLLVMIFDLFAFPSLSFIGGNVLEVEFIKLISNKLLFPIWIFYMFIFIKESTVKSVAKAIIWLVYIGYFGFTNISVYGELLQQTSGQQTEAVKDLPGKVFKNYVGFFNTWLKGQVQYAITGKVEQNQYEPLGVYLENVKPADAKYFENEDVVIWGTVRARTLDDPINVKLGCYVKDGTKKTYTDNVDPNVAFPVFTLEEQDFACTLKTAQGEKFENILKSGSTTITAFADFNFETLAFLKVYFMDRERLRAMTRDNLDPFDEFGIKDKKPQSKSTNGPAHIGMETTSPLVGVGESYITFPTLSMSIQNNQGWQGRIKKFEEVILLLPKGVGLTSPETDCGERKFSRYDGEMCRTNSCTKVNAECINVCESGYTSDFDKNNCKALCDDKLKACQNDCSFLFEEEGQQYEGFALIKEDIEKINAKLAKDDQITGNFEFFRCKLSPKPEEVLQNTPITTKSIRAKARYQYTVEKPVPVRIEKLTDAERTTKIGEVALKGLNEIQQLIVNTANQNSVDPIMALAIASVESNFRHCCATEGRNTGQTCQGTTETSCLLNRLIISTDGSSRGIMQIFVSGHPDLFSPGTQRLNSYGCSQVETAYDLGCNIKSGVNILKENIKTCKNDLWAAVGMYNTGSCNSNTEYTTKVRNAYNSISSQQLPQQGFSTINAPTNLAVFHTIINNEPAIILSWDKSTSPNVEGYTIIKSVRDTETQEQINAGNANSYTDTNVQPGLTYTYRVVAKSGNFQSVQSEPVNAEIQETQSIITSS